MAKIQEVIKDLDRTLAQGVKPVQRIYRDRCILLQVNTTKDDQCASVQLDLVHGILCLSVTMLKPCYREQGSTVYNLTPPQTDKIKAILLDRFFPV